MSTLVTHLIPNHFGTSPMKSFKLPPPSQQPPSLVLPISQLSQVVPTKQKDEETQTEQAYKHENNEENIEEILKDSPDRYCLFPIKYPDIFAEYKKSLALFWTTEEIDLSQDKIDFREKLNDNERHFIKHILAFFASADGIVIENLVTSFCDEVKAPEAKAFYAVQMMIETIHSELYSLMIDTLVEDTKEKMQLFSAIDTLPCVMRKAEWAIEWISSSRPFAERLVAFAIVEGVFFSGAFCSIFWLKKRGLMPGLAQGNLFISRDEGMHTDFACLLFRNHINNKPSRERVLEIMLPAVEMEKEFVQSALPVSLIGMNQTLMSEYIEFVADRLLNSLGFEKHYNSKNPFDFMELISLDNKTNFFEHHSTEYQKSGVIGDAKDNSFGVDEDF